MTRLLLGVAVVAGLAWTAWTQGLVPAPLQQRVIEALGGPSAPYAAFQEFATAMVRGDRTRATSLAANDAVRDEAMEAYLSMRRFVRDVFTVRYQVEQERPAADGKDVHLTVSHMMTVDLEGTTSAFGTLTCGGDIRSDDDRHVRGMARDGDQHQTTRQATRRGAVQPAPL